MVAAVHLLAGLNGSGKTTLARRLENELPGVRFSLDEWMLRLHGMRFDHERYPERAELCRELIWDIAAQVLRTGVAVILDWNMWSQQLRADAVHRARKLGAECHLHYLNVSLQTAQSRAVARTDPASHQLTADGIAHLAALFEPPDPAEGFILHEVR